MFVSLNPSDCKVALLSGGKSGEREISIASGKGAFQALTEAGYQVTQLDPANKEDLKTLIDGEFDVAFLTLHGKYGEDGRMQGFLEMIDLPYTGSGVWSSALAMDKVKAKVFYTRAGIPTPKSISLVKDEVYDAKDIICEVGDKCVVKAATEGSSLGVYIVEGAKAVEEALENVFKIDDAALIETYVKGTELTVAVIGNENPTALPVIEIVPKSDSYDFESKYAPGGSQHICPARISEDSFKQIQQRAVEAHKALGCSGVSRSDFILEEDGSNWVLETNTLPGMTGTSLLPDAARAAGISFPELCTMLIRSAMEKHAR